MEEYRHDSSLSRRYYRCGGVKHGQYISYNSNGSIWSMETHNMGKNIGIELYMNDEGNIYILKRYNDKGEKNGHNYYITEPGVIWKFTNYKDGKKDGRCYRRDIDDMSEFQEELYKDGEPVYSYRFFYYTGPKIESVINLSVNQQQSVENDRHS